MEKKNDYIKGIGLAFLAALLWSGNYIVARGLHEQITPISLAFVRWLTATVILFPIAYKAVKKDWQLIRKHWKLLSITAFLGITLFNTFIYVAAQYSSATNIAIIGTTASPIFVLIFAYIFLKEKISVYQVIGMLVCIAGILLLLSKGLPENLGSIQFSRGDFWILLAALSFALYTLLVRKKPKGISALSYLFVLFFLGTLFLIPAFVVDSAQGLTFIPTTKLLLVFLYLGCGASIGSFLSWNVAIQKLGAARTALFSNLIPVFSSIEAVLILGEESTWVLVVSLMIIIAGLLIANYHLFKGLKP